jgi:ferric-dicitrate binding protein FerR (iron transport regulator)
VAEDSPDPDPELEPVERALRAARPTPDAEFAGRLERRLLGAPRRPRRRRRPLFAGVALAGALALAALALSLAGVGPLAGNGTEGVRARSRCHFVTERRLVRVAEVVDGRLVIHRKLAPVRVRKCRPR